MRTSWVDEVRSRAKILDVADQYTKVGSAGSGLRGPCPLHGGKDANFAVYPERNTYRCYVCDSGGDPFSLVMEMEGLDFIGAAKHLAAVLGVDIPAYRPRERSPEERKRAEVQERLAPPQKMKREDVAEEIPAEAAESPWEALGLGSLVSSWGLGAREGFLTIPIYERDDVPLGWLRYQNSESEGLRFHSPDPASDPSASEALFHHPSLPSLLRRDVLIVVDDASAVLALAQLGYRAALGLSLSAVQEGESWISGPQADWLAEMGVREAAFLIPMGAEAEGRRRRMKSLFATESVLLERGIEPLIVTPAEGEGLRGGDFSGSWDWARALPDAEALRHLLGDNRRTFDFFQLRVSQLLAASRRSRGIGREEILAKLSPSLSAARRSGERALYHAYLAWACRAFGERDRKRFSRALERFAEKT